MTGMTCTYEVLKSDHLLTPPWLLKLFLHRNPAGRARDCAPCLHHRVMLLGWNCLHATSAVAFSGGSCSGKRQHMENVQGLLPAGRKPEML